MTNERDERAFDLHALAIQQQLLDEWSAGRRPRLSVYARRYPAYSGMLADLFATMAPEARETQPGAAETPAASFPEHLWTGAGVGRALNAIFGDASARDGQRLPRVAEERATYHTGHAGAPPKSPDPDPDDRA